MQAIHPFPLPRLEQLLRLAPTARSVYCADPYCTAGEEAAIERRFFDGLRLANGVFRSTRMGRLEELNKVVNALLPGDRRLFLLDVAISSGVTTADWIRSLRHQGIDFHMTASDLCLRAALLSFGSRRHVLIDRHGYPLQYEFCGLGLRTSSGRRWVDLPLALVRKIFMSRIRKRATWNFVFERPIETIEEPGFGSSVVIEGIVVRPVLLVSRRLWGLSNLTLLEEDLLKPPEVSLKFDAIRAANILNRRYFAEGLTRRIVDHLQSRLHPQGLLIVCRTEEDGTNHGTVFQSVPGQGFSVVKTVGSGSGLEHLMRGES